jgi:hypothetical protein
VATSQGIIASSFSPLADDFRLVWPGIGLLKWCPAEKLIDQSDTVRDLVHFVTRPASSTPEGRIRVCTHQAAVAFFKVLREMGRLDCLDDVMLTLDEAHHAYSVEDDTEDRVLQNRLGEVVRHYYEHDLYIDMFTATWMRTNYLDIIPAQYTDSKSYFKYVLPVDEYLKGMKYLREVAIRFLIGSPEDALQHLLQEGHGKTIVYTPPVGSEITTRYGDKYNLLTSLQKALGPAQASRGFLQRHRTPSGTVSTLDLIEERGREERKQWLTDTIRSDPKAVPDLIFSLGMCKEGFNWPAVERMLVIGARNSMVEMVQMLGRGLRDYPGKERVEYNIVLPYTGKEDPHKIQQYLKVMLSSMVIEWQFRTPTIRLTPKEKKVVDKVFVQDPGLGQRATAACVDASINAKADDDVIKVTRKELDRYGLPLTADEKDNLTSALTRMIAAKSLIEADEIPFEPTLVRHVYGCVRGYAMKFGYSALTALREALGKRPVLERERILIAADNFHAEYVRWPTFTDKDVPGLPGETWGGINQALMTGGRGLQEGGLSLARLLLEYRGVRSIGYLPPLALIEVLTAGDAFYKQHGHYPLRNEKRAVPGMPDETWSSINLALYEGRRGLPKSSLSRVFREHRGVGRHYMRATLTTLEILQAGDAFFQQTGSYPKYANKSAVPGMPNETWAGLNRALYHGFRGLPGSSSLAKLFLVARGIKYRSVAKPPLKVKAIIKAGDAFRRQHSRFPKAKDKQPISGMPNETWRSINEALKTGRRGLPGGLALVGFWSKHRGVGRPKALVGQWTLIPEATV